MSEKELSHPLSHVKLFTERDINYYRLSPTVRVIISEEKILIFDNLTGQILSLKKTDPFVLFFTKIAKQKISLEEIISILSPHLNHQDILAFLRELQMGGIIW